MVWCRWGPVVLRCVFDVGVEVEVAVKGFGLLGASGTLAPLAGAVDSCAVGFEGLFAFEHDVSLDDILCQRDLKELAGAQGPITPSPCLGDSIL